MDEADQQIIETIRQDHSSGAAQLAVRALNLVEARLARQDISRSRLDRLLSVLAKARPSMVPLANAVARCRQQLADNGESPQAVVRSVREQLENANRQVAGHATALIPDGARVLTHSRSSQVLALFQRLAQQGQPFSVICTQSAPGNEGFTLARELDQLGVPVTLITDAQMGLFVDQAELILCGCDTWLADGHFINKSGSYLLALAAADRNRPFWVLADSFKDSDAGLRDTELEEMTGDELGAPAGQRITPRNIYFEPVPTRLIAGRVSEQGVFSYPDGARR